MYSTRPWRFAPALLVLAALALLAAMPGRAAADDEVPAQDTASDEGKAKPASATQADEKGEPGGDVPTRPSAPKKPRRGGINPCMTPDPGFGIYDGWQNVSIGQVLMPHSGGIAKNGGFDLIVHFHGHEPVRKEFVKTAKGIVLVGIDLGIGSGAYTAGFSAPATFTNLIASVEAAMAKHTGNKKAHVRKLALSSWSAGYGATEQILHQPAGKKVDAVILLDSLHAGYVDENAKTLKTDQLAPFVAFAKRAAAKQTFMFQSHSSIIPPGYASTTEVADFVVMQLGGKPKKTARHDVLGLDMIDRFDKGNYHMRGYTGDDKPDHCAHIGLMADIVKSHLNVRWKTPKGKK